MNIKLFLLFVMTIPVYAQLNVSGFVGINPQSNFIAKENSDFLDLYWQSGIVFGAGSEIFVSPSIALSPSVEYAHYKFDKYNLIEARAPEVSLLSTTGKPSNIWRLFVEAKFFRNITTAIPLYLTTGIGYMNEDFGIIHRTFKDMNEPNLFTETIEFENSTLLVHTLGIGLRWRILPYLFLDLKGQYFTNYNDRWYTSLKCGIVYTVFK